MAMGLGGLLLGGGLSMLPGLLSMFGGDPRKKYMSQVQKLLGPQNMGNLTQQFYQQGLGSPAFSQAQRQIAQGSNQAGNILAQRMGQAGIGGSGTGAVLSSMVPSMTGNALAGLQTGLYGAAQGQAQNSIQQQLQQLQAMGAGPSQNQQLFSGGMSAFGPMLQAFMAQRFPGMFGMGGGGGGQMPSLDFLRMAAGIK